MEDIIFTTQAVIAEGINPGKLTPEEEAILRLTEEVWNRFLELPIWASLYHEKRKSWPTKNGVPLRRGVKKLRY